MNAEFTDNENSEEALYYFPDITNWLKQVLISLVLDCRSSFRGIIKS